MTKNDHVIETWYLEGGGVKTKMCENKTITKKYKGKKYKGSGECYKKKLHTKK